MDDQSGPSKVAIPRLRRSRNDRKPIVQRPGIPRVQKACNSCRIRKIRCNGDRPHCQNCLDVSVQCSYPLARRDRLKEANEQISRLVALVNDLSNHVDDFGQHKIEGVLASMSAIDSPTMVPRIDPAKQPMRGRAQVHDTTTIEIPGSIEFGNDLGLEGEHISPPRGPNQSGYFEQSFELQRSGDLFNLVDPLELIELRSELSYTFVEQEPHPEIVLIE